MFEWLFKYPPTVFLHGQLLLRSAWPRWLLIVGLILAAVVLAAVLRGRRATGNEHVESLAHTGDLAGAVVHGSAGAGTAMATRYRRQSARPPGQCCGRVGR